jgi:hypothetical protein
VVRGPLVVGDDGTGGPQADLNKIKNFSGLQSRERPFIIEKKNS